MDNLEYADVPPPGFSIVSHDHAIESGDKVCLDLTKFDGGWTYPENCQNIIGASVRELYPRVMAVAVRNR
jgi:hypothetical protein